MTKPVIGYWNVQGRVAQIVYMLEYLRIDYDMEWYTYKHNGTRWVGSEWPDIKFTLGFDFPNLPYLKDGEFKMTETIPIQKYIAAKW